ncbi:MAG TPA: beta galactosidase jelly roll domain-containing protein, partial [Blastocatellia bacterium]|nr:beta galactosidase jelly roll domain-containing protein [Blastocatellia bacterium]
MAKRTNTRERLKRRDFILAGGAGLTGLALAPHFRTYAALQNNSGSMRRIFALNHKWLFSSSVPGGGTKPDFDDRRFIPVTIPHTNRVLPWHGFDDKEYEFVSLYRRHFKLPAELRGRRVFVDFGGVMTAATLTINGHSLGEYRGGYTPFSFELTEHINWTGDNVLAVEVDSTERADIPPFGGDIDYLTFGGIYRDVAIRVVAGTFIDNVFAKPVDVLTNNRRVEVRCLVNRRETGGSALSLAAELLDGDRVVATGSHELPADVTQQDVTLSGLGSVELWDLARPKLYGVRVSLRQGNRVIDHYETRFGFREARFTPQGFYLNGRHIKLRGLNRHQTFPFVGQAMPA